jgi:hypothetical protein
MYTPVGSSERGTAVMTTSHASTALRVGIVLLTLATALIHLQLAFPDPAFILNGLGYLTLLAALYLPIPRLARYRNIVRWVLIGFTTLTILLWILLGARTPIGYIDKAIEVALIALLLLEARRSD